LVGKADDEAMVIFEMLFCCLILWLGALSDETLAAEEGGRGPSDRFHFWWCGVLRSHRRHQMIRKKFMKNTQNTPGKCAVCFFKTIWRVI